MPTPSHPAPHVPRPGPLPWKGRDREGVATCERWVLQTARVWPGTASRGPDASAPKLPPHLSSPVQGWQGMVSTIRLPPSRPSFPRTRESRISGTPPTPSPHVAGEGAISGPARLPSWPRVLVHTSSLATLDSRVRGNDENGVWEAGIEVLCESRPLPAFQAEGPRRNVWESTGTASGPRREL